MYILYRRTKSHKIQFSESKILTLTAFGAGLLMSAAIFQMVVEAEKDIGLVLTMISFVAGAVIFTIADYISEKKGGGAGILLGIGLDSIPESLAIGASIAAAGPITALAVIIGIQNISEGIASYKEMMTGKTAFSNNSKKALGAIGSVSVLPIIFGPVGLFYFQGMQFIISLILALSAGGIFYMLYYDMIPKAHKERKWIPTFGAIMEFMLGFIIIKVSGG
jgi:zinc transporter, ZIP family